MRIVLYVNRSDNRQLNKDIVQVDERECLFKSPSSTMNPVVILSGGVDTISKFNYAYIPELDTYYFITDKQMENGMRYTLRLHEDVLQTYRFEIGNLNALIRRNEFIYNNYLVDQKIVPTKKRFYTNQIIGSIYEDGVRHIVINTAGGRISKKDGLDLPDIGGGNNG